MQEQQSSSFFKTAWQRSWRFFRKYWKRFQITRWLIVMVLFFTLVSVTYLTVIAKTSHVRSLQSNLSRSTVIYDQNHDEAGKLYAQKGPTFPCSKFHHTCRRQSSRPRIVIFITNTVFPSKVTVEQFFKPSVITDGKKSN